MIHQESPHTRIQAPYGSRPLRTTTSDGAVLKQREAVHDDFGHAVALAILENVLQPRLDLLLSRVRVGLQARSQSSLRAFT